MTLPLLVGVLGSRIVSKVAATIGYGNRELDLYPTSSIEPICDAGMLPVGVATADSVSGLDWCDLVSALVVPHDARGRAGGSSVADDDRHPGLPIVIGALARHLPVLAVGSGERLLTAALAHHDPSRDSAAEQRSRGPDHDDGPDLTELLGASGDRHLPLLVGATKVPAGMRVAVSGPDGSVYAVAADSGPRGPALSVRWDPGSLPLGDRAREGPFRWLRDHASGPRPPEEPVRRELLSVREEVQ